MDAFYSPSDTTWELMWAPYDQPTYNCVLQSIYPDDVVLEIGAGDLRLALQIAPVARRVFAIEIHSDVINRALSNCPQGLPPNLAVIQGDAQIIPVPAGVNVAVLLMRHCTHFKVYASKLKSAGCSRLITNARWKMGVERIDLKMERLPFDSVKMGQFACWCGATGFVPGPAEDYSAEMDQKIFEVSSCPICSNL